MNAVVYEMGQRKENAKNPEDPLYYGETATQDIKNPKLVIPMNIGVISNGRSSNNGALYATSDALNQDVSLHV